MKLIKPSWQIIEPTGYTIDDVYKSIELAGRVAHKSENKITEDSAKAFVGRMLNMKHLATCEFGTVYLHIDYHNPSFGKVIDRYIHNKYSKCNCYPIFPAHAYISSNYRVLIENNWLDDLQYLCEPTEYHRKRYTVKFVCDRSISHEFVRHRVFSFLQESTRYCNYSKDKFGNELTFIIPPFCDAIEGYYDSGEEVISPNLKDAYCKGSGGWLFYKTLKQIESAYMQLTSIPVTGNKPLYTAQEARAILPNALKTELYMCGFAEDWKHFFELRDNKQHAHPQAYELAHPLHEEFIKRGYLN